MKINDAYESMFGRETATEDDHFMPTLLPLNLNKPLISSVMEQAKKGRKWVLAFVIGTKPCFYKFYGSIVAATKKNIPFFIINSNQHYDDILTHGIREFDFQNKIASNFSIRGDLAQKSAELMIKTSWFAKYLRKNWPEVTVIPVVLGDTIMTSIVPVAWMFSRNEKAIQNEAGLRSMTPEAMKRYDKIDIGTFIDQQFYGKWILMRNEPFPEQYDTYTSAAASQYLFAPVSLNKEHLLREGYPEENIWVIGGVVADALELKRKIKPEKSIFSIYPELEKGDWIRADIHRRENLTPRRFKAIIGAIKTLVKKGYNINFIEMSATRMALDFYGLKKEIDKLKKKKNFLYTAVWPEYGHVIEFFESNNCIAALTDSGGVQEELNLIGKVCMTCRITTDRPETVFGARSNILVPPASKDIIVDMIKYITKNDSLRKKMESQKSLYGNNVGKKFISIVLKLMGKNDKPFKWAHDTLKLWSDNEKGIDYL
ncbi:MAG: UDP-N-acetylglucosamine 2-epimerase [Candidatus Woesearchaeota archaeon]|jgi:UDP-N-acetylglucosamine 2-epimerase (non-hydrolysing)|nr:UDP-N-acetylglucosamine 2-epimerase [Candidatus Woesearchaeota archaeon]MDP7622776.1 UDP-N-acetylglucosamine 2-epimerase [Candidatus Woesearchaeota archaeon]HJN56452.1 UDP-N-acetylglucosamine 2-epimerase [Candidatus Woesearchaeota archaeon]|tara:strand:+ start:53461 stop:54915 length:1455 start_codon:yes stop_codon:yes gene_type:complete